MFSIRKNNFVNPKKVGLIKLFVVGFFLFNIISSSFLPTLAFAEMVENSTDIAENTEQVEVEAVEESSGEETVGGDIDSNSNQEEAIDENSTENNNEESAEVENNETESGSNEETSENNDDSNDNEGENSTEPSVAEDDSLSNNNSGSSNGGNSVSSSITPSSEKDIKDISSIEVSLDSEFVSQTFSVKNDETGEYEDFNNPSEVTIKPGQTFALRIEMKNTGLETWNNILLGTVTLDDDEGSSSYESDLARVSRLLSHWESNFGDSVDTGSNGIFLIEFQAPSSVGEYNLSFKTWKPTTVEHSKSGLGFLFGMATPVIKVNVSDNVSGNNPSITFTNPTPNQNVTAGQNLTVKWESQNLTQGNIQLFLQLPGESSPTNVFGGPDDQKPITTTEHTIFIPAGISGKATLFVGNAISSTEWAATDTVEFNITTGGNGGNNGGGGGGRRTTTGGSTNSAPEITLLGDNPVVLTVGQTFNDPGATAFDSEDGNVTANIAVTGYVDTNTVGTYVLSYYVSDSRGLSALNVNRTVYVLGSYSVPTNLGTGGPTIYQEFEPNTPASTDNEEEFAVPEVVSQDDSRNLAASIFSLPGSLVDFLKLLLWLALILALIYFIIWFVFSRNKDYKDLPKEQANVKKAGFFSIGLLISLIISLLLGAYQIILPLIIILILLAAWASYNYFKSKSPVVR